MTPTRTQSPMAPSFTETVEPIIRRIDGWLADAIAAQSMPANLREAANHAVLVGGKRLRPLLTVLCCEALGGAEDDARAPAVALELVHAFSLVHDDLPALDNDLLRRGQPTVHAKYGEAMGVLAGDLLLTLAFAVVSRGGCPAAVIGELSSATIGMINGQVYDSLGGFEPDCRRDLDRLRLIHENKTGALLVAACRMGGICGGADPEQLRRLTTYGNAIGLMFQVVDDLLDVTQSTEHLGKAAGKDLSAGKLTFPGVMGVDASRAHVQELLEEASTAIAPFGASGRPLAELAEYMAVRTR
ncbi:MAG: polyprenyl synthetase family protein [Phycisphaerales bacterium]|nr:polyprenyl synthetase family protein [Phycisphaerales bacterium]